jgi:hypothetical protein
MTARRGHQLLFGVLLIALPSCSRESATTELCAEVLDRIVEVELAEQGFRDQALVERKKRELQRRFDAEVQRCVGRPVPAQALACVRNAASAEEISHRCLR